MTTERLAQPGLRLAHERRTSSEPLFTFFTGITFVLVFLHVGVATYLGYGLRW